MKNLKAILIAGIACALTVLALVPATASMKGKYSAAGQTGDLQYYDDTTHAQLTVIGYQAKDGRLLLQADQSDDAADDCALEMDTAGVFNISVGGTEVLTLNSSGDLAIDGDLTAAGDIALTGDLSVNDLTVTGAVTVAETITVVGDVDVTADISVNDLAVTGAVTVAETVTVTGDVDVTGDISVNDLVVTGTVTVAEDVDIVGDISVNDLVVTGTVTVAEDIDVVGDINVNDLSVTGALDVAEAIVATGGITIGASAYGNVRGVDTDQLVMEHGTCTNNQTVTFTEAFASATVPSVTFCWTDAVLGGTNGYIYLSAVASNAFTVASPTSLATNMCWIAVGVAP